MTALASATTGTVNVLAARGVGDSVAASGPPSNLPALVATGLGGYDVPAAMHDQEVGNSSSVGPQALFCESLHKRTLAESSHRIVSGVIFGQNLLGG